MTEIETLRAEVQRLRKALERVASHETFTVSRDLTDRDDELIARMAYAKMALEGTTE